MKVADIVTVPATAFGKDLAKQTFPQGWHTKKLEGAVVSKGNKSGSWRLRFAPAAQDDEEMVIDLARKDIEFVRRPMVEATAVDDSEDEEDPPAVENLDSSDDEGAKNQDAFFNEEPDHSVKTGKKDNYKADIMAGWKPDNEFAWDQRAKATTAKDPLKLNSATPPNQTSIFALGCPCTSWRRWRMR